MEILDSRTVKDKVSAKKNGYDIEMTKITSDKDVAFLFKEAIETELNNYGFGLGGGE